MAEILKIREITIDTMQHKEFNVKEEELKLIRFYQNDLNSAKLLINVTHDKVVTDFSSATGVQIAFLKPDCKRVFQDVQNVNQMQGKYYVVLSTQTLIAYGNVIAQLRFTFPNNKVIETCKFAFTVDESIMSDEAMKSTNEFPVIQKAIEAGKKLEGVDIDGIIAAGELAKGAVKKSGDTMTGDLRLNRGTSSGNRYLRWVNDSTAEYSIGVNSSGNLHGLDVVGSTNMFDYDRTSKSFNITSPNTNVVKKAEIYSSFTQPSGRSNILATGVDLDTIETSGYYAGNALLNAPYPTGVFYIEVQQHTVAGYAMQKATYLNATNNEQFVRRKRDTNGWTPWVKIANEQDVYKKTEIYSGWVTPDGKSALINDADLNTIKAPGIYAGQRFINAPEAITNNFFYVEVIPYTNTSYVMQRATILNHTNQRIWFRTLVAGTWQPWIEVTNSGKNGRVSLTLTADATAGSSNPQLATRRGNTVTLSLDLMRNAGATSAIVTTLPSDMTPVDSYTFDAIATDGTPSRVLIRFNGEIHLDVTGKRYRILATYVCN
ncbi:hypothetical protein A9486_20100 [Bacillus anthracis]|nr:hypothetical protein A9486_20100 [Bacillus anthracis]